MKKSYVGEVLILTFVAMLCLIPGSAFASGTGMPWEGPLTTILESITGPVAKIAGVVAICITGLALAFGEGGGLMRKILGIVFGLSIAFSASSFGLSFFGYGGGLGF
ncbi:MAG: conjugal transfer protein TrbC [Deltaproteobacteria bacterium HGW-Deltaproteobacteria-1]|jgi:type IV secretion system protein VirB2|nr:MAG: conjugal transfer protein TrbC [Deltaproteobacteria bacterium HGW-Deltaproteobacteria-1]